jgi:hypothetical protein
VENWPNLKKNDNVFNGLGKKLNKNALFFTGKDEKTGSFIP